MEQSIENFRKVYRMLVDEESRDIYLNKLNFLISSESKYMNRILDDFSPRFSPMDRSTFADILNAIDGDKISYCMEQVDFPVSLQMNGSMTSGSWHFVRMT